MKAKNGHKYAVILDNKVHEIFTIDEMPEWSQCGVDNIDLNGNTHPHCINVIDITKYNVKLGDIYNKENKSFGKIEKHIKEQKENEKNSNDISFNDNLEL